MNKTVLYPSKQKNISNFFNDVNRSSHFNNTFDNCTDRPSPKFVLPLNSEPIDSQITNVSKNIVDSKAKSCLKDVFHSNQQSAEKKVNNSNKNSHSVMGYYAGYYLDKTTKSINNKNDLMGVNNKNYRQVGTSIQNVVKQNPSSKENIEYYEKTGDLMQ